MKIRAKKRLKEIADLDAEIIKLTNEDLEREQYSIQSKYIFTESNTGNEKVSGKTFMAWLNSDEDDEDGEIGEDDVLGDELYIMADKYCAPELKACESDAEKEKLLYTRSIAQDCKVYDASLKTAKEERDIAKRNAEADIRAVRAKNLEEINVYNRGECLLAYRSCIADKGGCGPRFENCLDKKLLQRRANACEDILDMCSPSREYVLQDWAEEAKYILEEAEKYAELNVGAICDAQTTNCLEETCSISTDTTCLTDIQDAVGRCPIINQCDAKIPGFKKTIDNKLASLRIRFCESDVDKCLQSKCGADFSKPECMGMRAYEIAALCPQNMFLSCQNVEYYDVIVQSALLQFDYKMLKGCVDYFSERLSLVCGTDMKCLPSDTVIEALTDVPKTEAEWTALRSRIVANADAAVDEKFKQLEQDKTVAACADSQSVSKKKVKGKTSLGDSVFGTAKMLAKISAENRSLRELQTKIAELTKNKELAEARAACEKGFQVETPDDSKTNYSYIKSVVFESSLRTCHVCRVQQVCEVGGESRAASALKATGGGLAAGAGVGTMANAGWGTAIGASIGATAGGLLGVLSGGKKKYCQEIESCEDINM